MKFRSMRTVWSALSVVVVALLIAVVSSVLALPSQAAGTVSKAYVKKAAKKIAIAQLQANVPGSHVRLADTATNASKLGGVPASGIQKESELLSAIIAPADAGAAVVGGRGVVSVTRINTGFFNVTFNRDVSSCTAVASAGKPLNQSSVSAATAVVRGPGSPGGSDTLGIVVFDGAGSQIDGDGFHIIVLCP